jgi:plastin-1
METINASNNYQEKLANATYIINCARKMGAVVYTLPEDIVESNPKMVLCFVVTLMVLEKQMSQQHE